MIVINMDYVKIYIWSSGVNAQVFMFSMIFITDLSKCIWIR